MKHYSYFHSNKFISFWTDSKTSSIYVKCGTHIHLAYVIGTASRIFISVLFIGSLFTPSRRGIIYIDSSTTVLATVVFDLLLMISLGLLIGINRGILIRYNLINTGKEKISEKQRYDCTKTQQLGIFNPWIKHLKAPITSSLLLSCIQVAIPYASRM